MENLGILSLIQDEQYKVLCLLSEALTSVRMGCLKSQIVSKKPECSPRFVDQPRRGGVAPIKNTWRRLCSVSHTYHKNSIKGNIGLMFQSTSITL